MAGRQPGTACFACACCMRAGRVKGTNADGMGTDVALDVTSALTSFTLLFQPRPSAFLGSCISTMVASAICCYVLQHSAVSSGEVKACFLRSNNTAEVFAFQDAM